MHICHTVLVNNLNKIKLTSPLPVLFNKNNQSESTILLMNFSFCHSFIPFVLSYFNCTQMSLIKSAFQRNFGASYSRQQETTGQSHQKITQRTTQSAQNGFSSINLSNIHQFIENEVQRRLTPLKKRIQKLQRQLFDQQNSSKFYGVGERQQETIVANESEDDVLDESPILIENIEQETPQQHFQANIVKKSTKKIIRYYRSLNQQDYEVKCFKIDQIQVRPQHLDEWNLQSSLIKRIINERVKRKNNHIFQSEKKIILEFIHFGINKLALTRDIMLDLSSISRTSYKRWKGPSYKP